MPPQAPMASEVVFSLVALAFQDYLTSTTASVARTLGVGAWPLSHPVAFRLTSHSFGILGYSSTP